MYFCFGVIGVCFGCGGGFGVYGWCVGVCVGVVDCVEFCCVVG